MSFKFITCLRFINARPFAFKQLSSSLNFVFSHSTKKNKKIIEKTTIPNIKSDISAELEKDLQLNSLKKENEISETLNSKEKIDIVEELKTKRYRYQEIDQKMVEIDLKERQKEKQESKIAEKQPEKLEPTERLSKYLSRSGICSRREAEKLIKRGMIFVNNKKIDSNVAVSDTSKIKIYTKDGAKVPLKEETKLWMFYKPRGLVCSVTDQENRPTIFQYLREKTSLKIDHLISVGSMDFNCEGLLLVTNDGGLARTLELPMTNLERAYHIRVYGRFTPEKLSKLREGIIITGKKYGPFWAEILNRQTSNTWLTVKMETGKIREIRKVMQKLDLRVNRIKRIGFGPYKIGGLIPGDLVEIEIAPQIKKILYFNVKKKLTEHQNKIQEKLGSNKSDRKSLDSESRKSSLQDNQKKNTRRLIPKSFHMIEEK